MARICTMCLITGALVVAGQASAQDKEGAGYAFPPDKAGQLLEQLLRPAPASKAGEPGGPLSLPGAPLIEKPEIRGVAFDGDVPRTKPEFPGQVRPRPLTENLPLLLQGKDPVLPGRVKLPPGVRVKLQDVDVTQPVPLPILGQRQPDRAPLGDPTVEASQAAALAGTIPLRTAPAPFQRLNLPDPFEHRQAGQLRTPPPEEATPRAGEPRTPGKCAAAK